MVPLTLIITVLFTVTHSAVAGAEHWRPPLPTVAVEASLAEAFAQLTGGAAALLAIRDGRPLGIVTRLDVLEYLTHHPSDPS